MAAATARTAVQAAADATDGAAQIAAPSDRADKGAPAARIASAAARSPIIETRPPGGGRGARAGPGADPGVRRHHLAGLRRGAELSARARGPLDDITALGSQQRRGPATPRPRPLPARRRSLRAAARRGPRRRGEGDSGAAVGAAMTFPALMPVTALTQMLSDTTRAEQAPRAVANRAARAAALCRYQAGGASGAAATVRAGLERATAAAAGNRIHCNNDLAADADVVFIDADDSEAAGAAPPGGTAHAFSTRRIPPQTIGGFGLPALDAERLLAGGHHRPLPLPHRHLTPPPAPEPRRSARHCCHRSRETGRHSKSEQLLNRGFSVEPRAGRTRRLRLWPSLTAFVWPLQVRHRSGRLRNVARG